MSWINLEDQMPRHGQQVLAVAIDECGRRVMIRAHHIEEMTEEVNYFDDVYEPECDYDEDSDTYYYAAGWYEQIDYWGELSSVHVYDTVTHWMPLPELPTA